MLADQEEIHRLSLSENAEDRKLSVSLLKCCFNDIPDKSMAWLDLNRLTCDDDWKVRMYAGHVICYSFPSIPMEYMDVAWYDIRKLMMDEEAEVRAEVVYSLSFTFSNIPNKYKPALWENIHQLASDGAAHVRLMTLEALKSVFSSISDKNTAWNDLHRLTNDENQSVKENATEVLGNVYSFIAEENKSEALFDLHRLTSDEDLVVRKRVAIAFGSVFQFLSEEHKSIAWADLHVLVNDEYCYVWYSAANSLGKICIYNASKSEKENDSRLLLEKAIHFFEIAANDRDDFNPAKFCCLFYRSFYLVLFKEVYSKKEIESYITAAKEKISGYDSRQKLIEAVEQLSKALEIAYDARESGSDWQKTLIYCSDICNYAEQLMEENKDKTPVEHSLYKIAKPSFDKRITELIDKLKENTVIAYDKSRNTPAEPIASFIKEEIYGWRVENQVQMEKSLNNLLFSLKTQIPNIPETKFIYEKIDEIKSYKIVEDQIAALISLIPLILQMSIESKLNIIIENQNKTLDKVTQIDKTTSDTNETVTRTENKVDLLLQTVNELKEIASKLKEEGNKKGSQDVNDIADKIKVLLENKDPKELILFIEKLREKVPSIFDEIEKSTASKDVKEKAKKGLKENIMKFGKDISTGVAINWIAAYLPSIVGAGASGLLVPVFILVALLSIDNLRNQDLK